MVTSIFVTCFSYHGYKCHMYTLCTQPVPSKMFPRVKNLKNIMYTGIFEKYESDVQIHLLISCLHMIYNIFCIISVL